MELDPRNRILAESIRGEVMLEHIKAIAYRVLYRLRPPEMDDEAALLRDCIMMYWRYQLAESICNHDRFEDGYCAKCGTIK